MIDIKHTFAQNRSEESGMDLWDQFVIPPYFDNLEFGEQKKSLIFEGGRGSGKTTLLRYLSYRTQFSPRRSSIDSKSLSNIGIYYKAETSYLTLFAGDGINESKWIKYFEHSLCLSILEEILGSIKLLHQVKNKISIDLDLSAIQFPDVKGFDETLPVGLERLADEIRRKRFQFATWINNIDGDSNTGTPVIYPLKYLLRSVIDSIRESISPLKDSVFHVFIDEYENLTFSQQRYINTLIKESEPPLSFHIAMKKNGMLTKQTLGNESIQQKEDYRTVPLEEKLEKHFDLFSAELFFFRLVQRGYPSGKTPIDGSALQDVSAISFRFNNNEYKQSVLNAMNQILPGLSKREHAQFVLNDQVLRNRLLKIIAYGTGNKEKSIDPNAFIDENFPEASVVSAAVLNQSSKMPSSVLAEFEAYKQGKSSSYKEWIHKYLQGTLFLIWLPLPRPCLLYSGREAFLSLSKLNIRHFLEMCHAAINKAKPTNLNDSITIPPEQQALAARETSNYFYEEIPSSGIKGNRLASMVETLGRIFKLSQERYSQSEFEVTHFAVASGELSETSKEIIREAVKWSILSQESETKVKADRIESYEYILNPIYAPYFGISFNKGRKLDLPAPQAEKLFSGNRNDLEELVKAFMTRWRKEGDAAQPSIFGEGA